MKHFVFTFVGLVVIIAAASGHGLDQEEEKRLKALIPVLEAVAEAIEHDAIIAFESQRCPHGWTEYKRAQGRFLLGADGQIVPGDTDGDVLHSHTGTTSEILGYATRKDDDCCDNHSSNSDHRHALHIENGGSLPPYLAVTFCSYTPTAP